MRREIEDQPLAAVAGRRAKRQHDRGTFARPEPQLARSERRFGRREPHGNEYVARRTPVVNRERERLHLVVARAGLVGRRGPGPLALRVPGRRIVLLLDPADVRRVLEGTPTPFTAATREKTAALGRFEPAAVLVSAAADRPARRRLNVHALDTGLELHHLAPAVVDVVRGEVDALLAETGAAGAGTGTLDWDRFAAAFGRIVRRVVLGDAARDDTGVTDLLGRLRQDGNWGPFHPRRPGVERELAECLRWYLAAADPDSLAGALASAVVTEAHAGAAAAADADRTDADAAGQLPHWLFAYDAAAIACYRALAALSTHPGVRARLDAEAAAVDLAVPQVLPFARAVVLESLRLWPTTLVILRESTAATAWGDGVLPAGTTFLIVSSYLHRDPRRVAWADRLDPDAWLDDRVAGSWSLVPFSGGPAGCPGRNVVLLTASTLLAALAERVTLDLVDPAAARLDPARPLAGTVDHLALRFTVTPARSPVTPVGSGASPVRSSGRTAPP